MTLEQVTAIVPAFNEELRIASTVRALREAGCAQIIVIDDGSRDRTAERARRAGARVVRLPANRGKGAAVRAGVRVVDTPVVLLCDADLGDSAANLAALAGPVISGAADMTVASPPRDGSASGFGLVESLARWGIERRAGLRAQRPLSGQRAIRRDALADTPLAGGFGLEVGLTIDFLRRGKRVVEVPVTFTHARTGKDLRGFSHRARQGLAVAGALAGRRVAR